MRVTLLTKVEEELGQDVDGKKAVGGDVVVGETHDDEEDGQNSETTHLDGLAAESVNGSDGNPVSRDGTSKDNDNVADGSVVQELVDIGVVLGGVANGLEDDGVIQRETIEGDIEAEP